MAHAEGGPPITEDTDAPPPQLRGKVVLSLPKATRVKDIMLSLTGVGRTDWPEGIGQNRIEMAEQVPILRLKTSIFRSNTGMPIALGRVPETTRPPPAPLPPSVPGKGAVLTRLDDIYPHDPPKVKCVQKVRCTCSRSSTTRTSTWRGTCA